MDVDFGRLWLSLDLLAPVFIQQLGLLERVDAGDAPEVGDLSEVLAAPCGCVSFISLENLTMTRVGHTRL